MVLSLMRSVTTNLVSLQNCSGPQPSKSIEGVPFVADCVVHCLVLATLLDMVPGATIVWLVAIKAVDTTIALLDFLLWIVQAKHGRGASRFVKELLGANFNPAIDAWGEVNVKILDDLVASKAMGAFLLLCLAVLPDRWGVEVLSFFLTLFLVLAHVGLVLRYFQTGGVLKCCPFSLPSSSFLLMSDLSSMPGTPSHPQVVAKQYVKHWSKFMIPFSNPPIFTGCAG